MFNPLVDSFEHLTDVEVEDATRDLSRKYFQTRNPHLQEQISAILDMYREELRARMAKKSVQTDNPELDNLIKVS